MRVNIRWIAVVVHENTRIGVNNIVMVNTDGVMIAVTRKRCSSHWYYLNFSLARLIRNRHTRRRQEERRYGGKRRGGTAAAAATFRAGKARGYLCVVYHACTRTRECVRARARVFACTARCDDWPQGRGAANLKRTFFKPRNGRVSLARASFAIRRGRSRTRFVFSSRCSTTIMPLSMFDNCSYVRIAPISTVIISSVIVPW